MRRVILSVVLGAALPIAATAQQAVTAAKRPTCKDGSPFLIYIVDATSDTDCSTTGGGVTEAPCLCLDGTWTAMLGGGSGGGVTSVALAVPSEWTVSGSPITTSGTITISEATQSANTVYAGPTSGGAAAPGFRALVAADLPYQRLPSMDWPPATAPDWSCEFDGSLCSGTGFEIPGLSLPPPISGTIDPWQSWTVEPIYDVASSPGKLCFQSDDTSAQHYGVYWDLGANLPTSATLLAKFTVHNRNLSAVLEGGICLSVYNISKFAHIGLDAVAGCYQQTGSAWEVGLLGHNNGTLTNVGTGTVGEAAPVTHEFWIALQKSGNDYRVNWTSAHDGVPMPAYTYTKTGVTDMDRIGIRFYTANETPSIIQCVDYLRVWNSLKYDFVNE